jgi:glycerophosphoryl diester phosphodiesterase
MVEFDVKLSSDDVPFLLHDDTLDRTTNGRGPADALSWAELAQLDAGSWHSAAFAGERLPTLAAVAEWALAAAVACNIEIKPMPGSERGTGTAVALAARALWRGAQPPPLLSSFSEESLAAARASAPELARALLVEEVTPDWGDRLSRLDCVALDADFHALDASIVTAAHKAGRRVLTYTPNDASVIAQLLDWGVDGIITDAIDIVHP